MGDENGEINETVQPNLPGMFRKRQRRQGMEDRAGLLEWAMVGVGCYGCVFY